VGDLPVTNALKPQTDTPQSQTTSYSNFPKSSFNELNWLNQPWFQIADRADMAEIAAIVLKDIPNKYCRWEPQ